MTLRERIIYGAVVALAVFFVGHIVLGAGSLLVDLVFAIAMGFFAILAVTIAARVAGKRKR
ncbi:MAG: hypothetical protein AAF557_17695 [Pseudomonadota bacterium]